MKIFVVLVLCVFVLAAGILTLSYSEKSVPEWVKNAAKWYGDGVTSEQEYLDSVKFLIENNIITIDKTETIEEPITLTPEESFTDPRIITCNVLYPTYVSYEQSQFLQEYLHINYIRDCIDLYEDGVWHYKGEDRHERIHSKFTEIHKQNIEFPPEITQEASVDIRSIINIGSEKSMIKFDICAGDVHLDKAKVLVKSDTETILIGSDKDVPKNSCRNYETQIYAKYPKNIEIEIIETVLAED